MLQGMCSNSKENKKRNKNIEIYYSHTRQAEKSE